jgi:putative transposase
MIERTLPKLSVGAQCRLLSISRSSFYYAPQGETALNLYLMLLIDKQFLETPFYGIRQMACVSACKVDPHGGVIGVQF